MEDSEFKEVVSDSVEKIAKLLKLAGDFFERKSVEEYIHLLVSDTDRGCILSIGETFSFLLEKRIRKRLQDLSEIGDKELDSLLTRQPLPPVGSFGVRITLAYALGIIDHKTKSVLRKIKNLRNKQAHSFSGVQIDKKEIESLLEFYPERVRKRLESSAHELLDIKEEIAENGGNTKFIETPQRRLLLAIFMEAVLDTTFGLPGGWSQSQDKPK